VTLPMPEVEQTVGVDLGLTNIVVCSDGHREPAPRFYRHGERRLRRAQRVHSRRQKGSRNRAKARARLARVYHSTWPTSAETSCTSSLPRWSGSTPPSAPKT
jgi:transposase